MKSIYRNLVALCLGLACAPASLAFAEASKEIPSGDVIARVEDQPITFTQLNTMLNSSAVVGVSIPALGTPERDTARIVILDKVISANLLYLDARRQGLDNDPVYQREMRDFSNGMLANAYRQKRDYKKAYTLYLKAAELQPDSDLADKAMEEARKIEKLY